MHFCGRIRTSVVTINKTSEDVNALNILINNFVEADTWSWQLEKLGTRTFKKKKGVGGGREREIIVILSQVIVILY